MRVPAPSNTGASTAASGSVRASLIVKAHHRVEIETREHVAVAHDDPLFDSFRRESDRTCGSERFLLDDIAQDDVAEHVVARLVGGEVPVERVRQVAHRQHDLVDAVRRQPGELPFQVRLIRDGQQRLRGREGQRPQPGSLAPDEDDRFHGFDVAVVAVVGVVARCVEGTVTAGPVVAEDAPAVSGLPNAFARFGTDGGSPMLAIDLPGGRNAITTMSSWISLYDAGLPDCTVYFCLPLVPSHCPASHCRVPGAVPHLSPFFTVAPRKVNPVDDSFQPP